jgi:GNAT superfamily N-acetyltransferase
LTPPADDGIEIRMLGEDDVPALIALIRRCYGESYTEPEFYDASWLRIALASDRLVSVGAVVGSRVVGHIGTRIPIPGDVIVDTVGGVVDPTYRGLGLTARMGARMAADHRDRGIVAARHVATGAHDRTQRLIADSGGVATGVLLGHVPAGTDYRGIEHGFGDSRIGVVVYFQMWGRLDQLDVYLPERYADQVVDLYAQVGLERHVSRRQLTASSKGTPAVLGWAGSASHDAQHGIAWLRFGELADDTARPAIELLEATRSRSQPVTYADVPIADPRSVELIELLNRRGFFFGALMPGTAGSEAIRLQRLDDVPIEPHAIVTASPQARLLLGWITAQYEQETH